MANKISRRGFLRLLNQLFIATGMATVLGPIIAYFFPSNLEEIPLEPMLVGTRSDIPAGISKTVQYGRYPALIVNTSQGLRAYSAVCTHFACLVKWDADLGQVVCPCHEGFFDALDGRVISGPPPVSLKQLLIVERAGQIYLEGEA